MKKKLRVGFDFDGVIAYNPLRVARLPATVFKQLIFRQKKTQFFVPKSGFEKKLWELFHDTSFFAAPGVILLRQLVKNGYIEAYLISGRFSYLEGHLYRFLDRKKLRQVFKEIHINKHDEQPHEFKRKMLQKLDLDIYIEDNWDIVSYLAKNNLKTRIYWITNLLDQFIIYPHKYSSLKRVLKAIRFNCMI